MFDSAVDWATIISAACALIGVPLLFAQRHKQKSTVNRIKRGSGNIQVGGNGDTKNSITDGDDNEQRG